ncbi:hypothetical protein H4R99_003932 [Coemansia sp. RSA 1722]|nr:hypothetical protein H4R99_003932 [Coemansia sp. RSA 1722]
MGLQEFFAWVTKARGKPADLGGPYPDSDTASTISPVARLYPVVGTLSNSSETTLVDNMTYIGGHVVRNRNRHNANRPRSQFTLGPTRVIVCN